MLRILGISLFLLIQVTVLAQPVLDGSGKISRGDLRVLFYNVENCFDCFDDTTKLDNEFLPQGVRHWTWEKYKQKTQKIAKVIVATGGWVFPDIIGLCEIENRFVLDGIFNNPYFRKIGYKIIHRESPDHRGIDVAFIYQPEVFTPIDTSFLQVIYEGEKQSTTREVVYVKGKMHTSDVFHIFVNHWPSRWGGQIESEHKRIAAARVVRHKIDSIFKTDSLANILLMGDFNDYPNNKSIISVLKAKTDTTKIKNNGIYNLAFPLNDLNHIGSYKYQGRWGMLDQFMVSGSLLNKKAVLYCTYQDMHLFAPPFLLEEDKTNYGQMPFRTFRGYKYNGGFSDHLPIVLDFWRK